MKITCLLASAVFLMSAAPAEAQRGTDYDRLVVQQTRIDARDLGYPPADVIPNGESAITSLSVAPNGNIYGATSGKRSHLFVLNPRHGYVQPLGFLANVTSVTNALSISASGDVYIGTSPGGRLLKYTPENEDQRPIRVDSPCAVADLGRVAEGESVHALVLDQKSNTLYGLTGPGARFFSYSIGDGKFADLGSVAEKAPEGEKFETAKTMSRMLITDAGGNVYCSGEDGYIFKFDAPAKHLVKLTLQLPAVPGREPWTRADAFLSTSPDTIYGGTSDGYLFRFDPQKLEVHNLGKPLIQYHIAGLALGANGRIYGVGGDEDDLARLFSYDPAMGTYQILGFVDVNRRPYYSWQAYVIQAMTAGRDGTIYIGQSERMSKLYLFYPY